MLEWDTYCFILVSLWRTSLHSVFLVGVGIGRKCAEEIWIRCYDGIHNYCSFTLVSRWMTSLHPVFLVDIGIGRKCAGKLWIRCWDGIHIV